MKENTSGSPLQCNTATLSGDPSSQVRISRAIRGRMANGGALRLVNGTYQSRDHLHVLMIWKWISADSPIEEGCGIRVLFHGAEIEHPEVLAVSMFEELLGVFTSVAIETLNTFGWISHDYNMIRYIC